jgi:DNA-binding IclR family transcriptional regulator
VVQFDKEASQQLRQVTAKAKLNKVTAFRLFSTLVSKGLIERVGKSGYRSRLQPLHTRSECARE